MEHTENHATFHRPPDPQIRPCTPSVFVPGDVLDAFGEGFLDEATCREWILKRLHPDRAGCPVCGTEISAAGLPRFWQGDRLRCCSCGVYFTAKAGTFLSGCHLSFRGIVLLALLIELRVPDGMIAAIVEMSRENVRLWRQRFRWAAIKSGKHAERST